MNVRAPGPFMIRNTMNEAIVRASGIHKRFSGVYALHDVSLEIFPGDIHCLAGENGSGKSTLIKVIAGVYRADEGSLALNGTTYDHPRPIDAIREGVQVIYQDFSLFPNMTVAENLAINTQLEQRKRLVRWSQMRKTAEEALSRIRVDLPLDATVGELSVADKQLVAISRALLYDAKLVIMDEPTTALTQHEVKNLFDVITDLKSQGIATLFVSHKLREVLDISEKLTILRNGRLAAEGDTNDFDEAKITFHMTGRQVSEERFVWGGEGESPLLSVSNLTRPGEFEGVSFDVYPGEIVGITGLLGSGRTSLGLSLFGVRPAYSGTIRVDGETVAIRSIQDSIKAGIAYVPEDRLTEGLFLEQSISRNIFVSILDRIKTAMRFVDFEEASKTVERWIEDLRIATPSAEAAAQTLSGGNQQRIVLARWLAAKSRILVLNGPTVGVDVGSKEEIHKKLRELASQGVGVVIMSDDIPEIVQNCNRIFVMHKGRIVRELTESFDTETLVEQFEELK